MVCSEGSDLLMNKASKRYAAQYYTNCNRLVEFSSCYPSQKAAKYAMTDESPSNRALDVDASKAAKVRAVPSVLGCVAPGMASTNQDIQRGVGRLPTD